MTKHKHQKDDPKMQQPESQEVRAPYWAHAHRDWRFLLVVFLMLACITVYVMSGNLAWGPRGRQVPVIETGGK